jgi:non-specific serine/threonine protein kinase
MLIRAALVVAFALAGSDWTTHAPLPVARTEVAAATLGREIAVVGGFLENGGSSRRLDFYAPGSNTWRSGPDLPAAVNHASATVARGRLYVAGGYGAERSLFVLAGDRWQTIAMPAPRAAAGAAALRGTVYVVGGVGTGGNARSMLAYDLGRRRWRTLPGPRARQHLAVTAARGRIYAIAGRTTGLETNFTLVESWAPGEKRWRQESPVPDARGGTGAAAVDGRIVSAGGEAPGGTVRTVYAYDVAKRRWSKLPDLRTPRHGVGVAALGGAVYVIGGGPHPGLYVSDANESLNVAG